MFQAVVDMFVRICVHNGSNFLQIHFSLTKDSGYDNICHLLTRL